MVLFYVENTSVFCFAFMCILFRLQLVKFGDVALLLVQFLAYIILRLANRFESANLI